MERNENEVPAGSVVINQIDGGQPKEPEQAPQAQQAQDSAPQKQEADKQPSVDAVSRLEDMLKASQSMIGKQSSEIGALRAHIEQMSKPPEGPGVDQQLNDLLGKMNDGEIDIADGMRQALALNSQLTASQVMNQLSQQQKAQEAQKVQQNFLAGNPDYYDVIQSGALRPYLESDPLSDEYTAYHRFKADERVKQLEADYQQKIAAAKEEGARLAKGSEQAGKVIGRQGSTAAPPQQTPRPFKNNQEATAAMMETLRQMRSAT